MAKTNQEEQRKAPILRFKGFTNDWEQRKISETNDIKDGTHDTPRYVKSGYPLITSKNLTLSNQIDFKNTSYITKKDFDLINKRSKVDVNDILFGMIGTIGNPVLVQKKIDFAIKNVALIKSSKNSNSYFLLSILNSNIFKKYAFKVNQGNTQRFISLSQIRNFTYFIPNISEQNKIAEMFKIVDNLITLYERKSKLLSQIKEYLLDNLFAENEYPNLRFKGFTNAWEQGKLLSNIKNIIDYRGKTPKKLGLTWNGDKNYPALSAINVEDGKINLCKTEHFGDEFLYSKWMKKPLKVGQVILTTEAPVGNVAQIKKKNYYILSQRVIAFETNKNLSDNFLYFLLQKNKLTMLRYSTGGTAKGISQKSLKQVKIYLSTNIAEQIKISSLINKFENLITLYESKLKKIKKIKKELLDTMFI